MKGIDFMKSCIVKRKFKINALAPSFALLGIGLIALVLLLSISAPLAFTLCAACLIAGALIAPSAIFTEYEYNLEGGTFSVALIKNKASRKELFACDIDHMIGCEKYNGQPLSGIRLDYSDNENVFSIVFNEDGKQTAVLFSPDEAFFHELFMLAPSKVKRNIM